MVYTTVVAIPVWLGMLKYWHWEEPGLTHSNRMHTSRVSDPAEWKPLDIAAFIKSPTCQQPCLAARQKLIIFMLLIEISNRTATAHFSACFNNHVLRCRIDCGRLVNLCCMGLCPHWSVLYYLVINIAHRMVMVRVCLCEDNLKSTQ